MHARGAPMHELLAASILFILFMNFWKSPIFKIMIETLINDQTLKLTQQSSKVELEQVKRWKKNSSICYKGKLFFDYARNITCIIISTRLNKHLKLFPEFLELVHSVETREPKRLFTIAPKRGWGRGRGRGNVSRGETLSEENWGSFFFLFFWLILYFSVLTFNILALSFRCSDLNP